MKVKSKIIREIFSGSTGILSSKRVLGAISMLTALGCTIYLVIRDGGTDVTENIIVTILIISASLLGLPAITGIWGKNQLSIGESESQIKEQLPEKCHDCPYSK